MQEVRSKQGHTNNKAKQHNTPKTVTFPNKHELPRVGHVLHMCMRSCIVSIARGEGRGGGGAL